MMQLSAVAFGVLMYTVHVRAVVHVGGQQVSGYVWRLQ